ncbi:phosphate ABC transporter permease PstA [Caulobacter sp. KR2-114]|uniref:phosphate ABC transporter permease PstA n=1 Tax=Caulobacter sp. KR2-114 TaxID=3400912 RepID=UPI003BFEEC38
MAASQARIAARQLSNGLFVGFCFFVTGIALIALTAILWSLVVKGVGGLNLDVFTMSTPAPGSRGGLLNAIVGSLMLCLMGMIICVTIGVLAGTWLAEFAGESRYGSMVRFLNDVLLSTPSILIGMFVWYLLVRPFHGFSGFAGGIALAIVASPVITRTTEEVLRLQPISLRESGIALGAPLWHVIRQILWRGAGSGMLTGALLAFARISGETAPLLFTALNNQFYSLDMTKAMANLPSVINQFALSAQDNWIRLAWVAALLITVSVLAVTIIARAVSGEPRRS